MRLSDYISRYPYTDMSALNIDYWIKLVGEAAEDIKALSVDNTAIRAEMAAFEQEVRDYLADQDIPQQVKDEVDNIMSEYIDEMSVPVLLSKGAWSNHKVLWVGDSYGNGWDGTAETTDPYTTASNIMGCSFVNISYGGAKFGSGGDLQYHYLPHIQEYVSGHSDMNEFTDVFILGGANDITANPNEDLNSSANPYSIKNTCDYVKEHFPNAKITIGMVARLANTGYSNATLANTNSVRDKYKDGALANHVNYLEGSEYINHDYRLLASDKLHLSNYVPMGWKLAELIMNGDFARGSYQSGINMTPYTSLSSSQLPPTTLTGNSVTHHGHSVIVDISDMEWDYDGNPISQITWRNLYKIAKVSGDNNTRNLFAACWRAIRVQTTAAVSHVIDTTTYHDNLPCTLYLYDNDLYISFEGYRPEDGQLNLHDVDYIGIRSGIQFEIDEAYC